MKNEDRNWEEEQSKRKQIKKKRGGLKSVNLNESETEKGTKEEMIKEKKKGFLH